MWTMRASSLDLAKHGVLWKRVCVFLCLVVLLGSGESSRFQQLASLPCFRTVSETVPISSEDKSDGEVATLRATQHLRPTRGAQCTPQQAVDAASQMVVALTARPDESRRQARLPAGLRIPLRC